MAYRRAKRSLGQNFLVDPNLQRKIVDAVSGPPGTAVLEIGPGRGALTRHLADRGSDLTAVELDDHLAADLEATFADVPHVRIVHGDVLDQDLAALVPRWPETRVVGNIPYNITSPIVFKLLALPYPADIVLMVQAEVASRMVAGPGSKTYGALSVGIGLHATPARLFNVPRKAFRPVPRVDSTVVRITPHRPPLLDADAAARVRVVTRAAFSWRRKQLGTILRKHPDLACGDASTGPLLESLGISPTDRPERLSPDDFLRLSEGLRQLR